MTSATAIRETVLAVSSILNLSIAEAETAVRSILRTLRIETFPIPPEAAALSIEAYERFGKGRHPAALNFGDCFADACARHYGVPLLCKGDDFPRTDIEAA